MNKEKNPTGAGADLKSASAPNGRKYVGPGYNYGLVIPLLDDRLVRPLDMTDDEIAALIEAYPPAEDWWE